MRKRGRPLASETKRIAIMPDTPPATSTAQTSCDCDDVSTVDTPTMSATAAVNRQFEVIKIEGQHSKKVVDTRDGVVRVVSERRPSLTSVPTFPPKVSFVSENPRCCCGPGSCNCTDCDVCVDRKERKMKRVRLKLKRQKKIKEEKEEDLEVEKEAPVEIEVEEVFVPVGNGLYRKERRNRLTGEVLDSTGSPNNTKNSPVSKGSHNNPAREQTENSFTPTPKSCCSKSTAESNSASAMESCCSKSNTTASYESAPKGCCSKSNPNVGFESVPKGCCSKSNPNIGFESTPPDDSRKHAAPLIIAPMCFDGLELTAFDFGSVMDQYQHSSLPPSNVQTTTSSPIGASPEDYYPTIAGVGGLVDDGSGLGLSNGHMQHQGMNVDVITGLTGNGQFVPTSTYPSHQQPPSIPSFGDFDFLSKYNGGSNPNSDGSMDGSDGFLDVVYAPSCVLPGQCQCGDDCKCEGCSTHGNGGGISGIGQGYRL